MCLKFFITSGPGCVDASTGESQLPLLDLDTFLMILLNSSCFFFFLVVCYFFHLTLNPQHTQNSQNSILSAIGLRIERLFV